MSACEVRQRPPTDCCGCSDDRPSSKTEATARSVYSISANPGENRNTVDVDAISAFLRARQSDTENDDWELGVSFGHNQTGGRQSPLPRAAGEVTFAQGLQNIWT